MPYDPKTDIPRKVLEANITREKERLNKTQAAIDVLETIRDAPVSGTNPIRLQLEKKFGLVKPMRESTRESREVMIHVKNTLKIVLDEIDDAFTEMDDPAPELPANDEFED